MKMAFDINEAVFDSKGRYQEEKAVRYLRFVCSKTVKAGEEQQQNVGSADN
jgi:hypothetical protein